MAKILIKASIFLAVGAHGGGLQQGLRQIRPRFHALALLQHPRHDRRITIKRDQPRLHAAPTQTRRLGALLPHTFSTIFQLQRSRGSRTRRPLS